MSARGIGLVCLGLLAACGAKTGLELPGGGGGGTGSSGGGGGPLAVTCTSAQLDGAPTPTHGYCPTRANQAPFTGPRSPQIVWTAQPFPITDPENYLPAEIVVDTAGTAYVLIDASPINPAGGPNRLVALDAGGTAVWSTSFEGAAGGLSLRRDGTLWTVERAVASDAGIAATAAIIHGLSPEGATVGDLDVPEPVPSVPYEVPAIVYGELALGSDGSFFLESTGTSIFGGGGLTRVSQGGTVLWTGPSAGPYDTNESFNPPLTLTPDDGILVVGQEEIFAFASNGQPTWEGPLAQVLAVDAQGNVVTLSASDLDGSLALMTLNPSGQTVRVVPLGAPQITIQASQIALAGDGTDLVLLADEVSSPASTKTHVIVTALEASGSTRWTATLDVTLPFDPAALSTHYGLFVDAGGTVIVTAGTVTGIDLASGSVIWTLQPPNTRACLRPAVLGAGGAIVASQCDGTVFLARDP